MNKAKRKRTEMIALAALTAFVVIVGALTTGLLVTQAVQVNMAFTDDVVAGIYLTQLALLHQLVTWLIPCRRRGTR